MNVLPSTTSPSAAATAAVDARGGGIGNESQHQHWRAELERAQWQARQRYESPPRAATRTLPAVAPAAADEPAQAAAARGANLRVASAASTAAKAPPPAGALAARSLHTPHGPAAAGVPSWAAAPGPTTLAPRVAPDARALEARPAATALPFELPDWPARATQACLQGKRLSVVLRDAALDAHDDGPHLRERLRAQCEACGLELAELLINGVPVEPVAQRSTRWQST
jgi:hypothetical protein